MPERPRTLGKVWMTFFFGLEERGSKERRLAGGPISVARMRPLDRTARFSSQVSLEANW